MTLKHKYHIDDCSFEQLTEANSDGYCLFEWRCPPKHRFIDQLHQHNTDVIFYSQNSAVSFTDGLASINVGTNRHLTIKAGEAYQLRAIEHYTLAVLLVCAHEAVGADWMATAEKFVASQG
jgi:hypothetical protein